MPLTQRIGGSWARQRFEAALFGSFGTAALLLAVSGIYAVVAYAVAQRTREMGIRLALGAPRGAVLRLVVSEGMTLPIAGLLAGGIAALLLTRLLRASLYEVTPTEPRVFVATVAILVGASFVACVIPARRATLVDPMEALRAE
jgi:ABC-type antimicrobial peptide transport system permease subunit